MAIEPHQFTCPDCGSHAGVKSRVHTIWDRLAYVFFHQPARCADCFRRTYCLISVRLMKPNYAAGSGIYPARQQTESQNRKAS